MPPLIVSLDQKDWIGLARGYYGVDPNHADIARIIVQVTQSGTAVFPLSVTHLDETVKRLEPGSRQRLAEFMVKVSQGWSILPATRIIDPEIEDAVFKQLGLPRYNLPKYAIKKGVSQLMGGKIELTAKRPIPADLEKKLLEAAESPEALLLFMKRGLGQLEKEKMREEARVATDRLEQIRLSESQIKDNDMRHRAVLAQYFISEINPKLISFLLEIGADPKVFADKVLNNQTQILDFFRSMPTSYCMAELFHRRDMLRERRIAPNDLHDVMGLSIALPYSDVVVTERMWHSIIIQSKLDKLRPTRVLSSVEELSTILPSSLGP